jgi:hypothetical protein
MNHPEKVESLNQPLAEPLYDDPRGTVGEVDFPDIRLARARKALRGLSALISSESAEDECLTGRRGDLSDLVEILREELEAGLTGQRIRI